MLDGQSSDQFSLLVRKELGLQSTQFTAGRPGSTPIPSDPNFTHRNSKGSSLGQLLQRHQIFWPIFELWLILMLLGCQSK
jgi:hypothetical protein